MPCAEVERIVQQLADACAKELEDSSPVLFPGSIPEGYVTPGQRDQAVVYLLKLSEHFGFDAETFGYAVTCLDRFLSRVKAQTRYLQCISLASLLIASKLSEEEEYVPKVSDFITVSRCSHTTADLRRMEIVMLQKIEWKVFTPTPVFFLQKNVVQISYPVDKSAQYIDVERYRETTNRGKSWSLLLRVSRYCDLQANNCYRFGELLVALGYFPKHLLTPLLKQCIPVLLQLMCQSTVMRHRGSVLALGVLNLELGSVEGIASHWIEELAAFGMITDEEYIHCCGLINDYLDLQIMICHESPIRRKRRRRKRSSCSVVKILPTIWEDNPSEQMDEEMAPVMTNDDVEMLDDQALQVTDDSNSMIDDTTEVTLSKTKDTLMILEDKDVRMSEYQGQGMTADFNSCEKELLQVDSSSSTKNCGKPLYSTVVKMSCAKTLCSSHSILSSTALQRQTLAY